MESEAGSARLLEGPQTKAGVQRSAVSLRNACLSILSPLDHGWEKPMESTASMQMQQQNSKRSSRALVQLNHCPGDLNSLGCHKTVSCTPTFLGAASELDIGGSLLFRKTQRWTRNSCYTQKYLPVSYQRDWNSTIGNVSPKEEMYPP